MGITDFLLLLLVAGLCGAMGQTITGYTRGGCLASIAIGFVGAVIGLWLSRTLSLPELFRLDIGRTSFPIVWSVVGSALFVGLVGFITRRPRG